eukprot:6203383-Pleurochrysis_carterae.AAC.6
MQPEPLWRVPRLVHGLSDHAAGVVAQVDDEAGAAISLEPPQLVAQHVGARLGEAAQPDVLDEAARAVREAEHATRRTRRPRGQTVERHLK